MGERVTIERDKRKKNPLSFYPLERRSQSGIPACTSVGPIVYFAMQNFVNSSPTARTSSAKLFDMKEINGLTLNGQPAETKQREREMGGNRLAKTANARRFSGAEPDDNNYTRKKKRAASKKRVGGYHFSDPKGFLDSCLNREKQVSVVGDKDDGGAWQRTASTMTIHRCKRTKRGMNRRWD